MRFLKSLAAGNNEIGKPAYAGIRQLSAMLRLRYSDGTVEWKRTDGTWRYFYDTINATDIFQVVNPGEAPLGPEPLGYAY